MHSLLRFCTTVFSCWLSVACGGSDVEQSINTVELADGAKQAMSGDWPITGYYAYYTV